MSNAYGLVRQIGPWRSTANDRRSVASFQRPNKSIIRPYTVRAPGLPGNFDPFKGWHVVSKKIGPIPKQAKRRAYGRGNNPVRLQPFEGGEETDFPSGEGPDRVLTAPIKVQNMDDHFPIKVEDYSPVDDIKDDLRSFKSFSSESVYPQSSSSENESPVREYLDKFTRARSPESFNDTTSAKSVRVGSSSEEEIVQRKDDETLRESLDKFTRIRPPEIFHRWETFDPAGRNPSVQDYFGDPVTYPTLDGLDRVHEFPPVRYPDVHDDAPPANDFSYAAENARFEARARSNEASRQTRLAAEVPNTVVTSGASSAGEDLNVPIRDRLRNLFDRGAVSLSSYRDLGVQYQRRFNAIVTDILRFRDNLLRQRAGSSRAQIAHDQEANRLIEYQIDRAPPQVQRLVQQAEDALNADVPLRRSTRPHIIFNARRNTQPVNYLDEGSDGSQKDAHSSDENYS